MAHICHLGRCGRKIASYLRLDGDTYRDPASKRRKRRKKGGRRGEDERERRRKRAKGRRKEREMAGVTVQTRSVKHTVHMGEEDTVVDSCEGYSLIRMLIPVQHECSTSHTQTALFSEQEDTVKM